MIPKWLKPPKAWNPAWRALRAERDRLAEQAAQSVIEKLTDKLVESARRAARIEALGVLRDNIGELPIARVESFDPFDDQLTPGT